MSGNRSKTIAFNYFGGKFTYLDELYQYFPSNFSHLIDVFGGSFAVSLNYRGNVIKTANDLNSDITNFFRVLRDHEEELIRLLMLTPVSEEEYTNCWEPSENNIEQARRFYVRVRQSFFGLGAQQRNKGFHMAKTKVNCRGGETVSRWNNAILKLYEVANVIRENFQILNQPYQDLFVKLDFDNALFYLDPSYVPETRASHDDYKFDFSENDHIELIGRALQLQGNVMISGYNNPIYQELLEGYAGWQRIGLKVKKNNLRSSLRAVGDEVKIQECVWVNYRPGNTSISLI